eukprot:CAMPEP_0170073170 /NCGR_PEP_ID=MMETSP0019_2-20121128/10628_1 /TAXON_ID=98059 /ORGANISM="Dinobryon sp., Strain UTEXLB2267" /LENGTH=324 /DNA_ID=CAMNT_0010282513 /DNA_START=252 /DNA_END=1226 /DNA_ORIENTATION=+
MKKVFNPKFITSALVALVLVFAPILQAYAVPSGGRSGGSSFRSSSSGSSYRSSGTSRSYSSGGYSGGYQSSYSPIIVSPFSYGFGFSPFSFIPVNFNTLLFCGLAYAAYVVLTNRVGGSNFSNEDDSGSLGSGATVIKIQIGLDADWSQDDSIMRVLSYLASKNGALTTRTELSNLLSEASIALLRRQGDWNAAAFDGEVFGGASKAEPVFQRISISERTKFDKESTDGSSSVIRSSSSSYGTRTQAVVSIVAAIRGKSDAFLGRNGVRSSADVKRVLQSLASEALTDEGDNVMGVEVLWTPSEPGTSLTDRDIISDYPELIKL